MSIRSRNLMLIVSCFLIPWTTGCSQSDSPVETSRITKSDREVAPQSAGEASSSKEQVTKKKQEGGDDLPVITFGGGSSMTPSSQKSSSEDSGKASSSTEPEIIISHLKELQILLGDWRGITKKTYGGFKAVDQTKWVWDFRTIPAQPAIVMSSSKSPYYRLARMTFLPVSNKYQLTLTDTEGIKSSYLGKFTSPIEDIPGDDKTLQRSYKLEFTQTASVDEKATRFVFNQKNNNRYLLEYYRQRGSDERFFRVDTVSTQREGTSFALIDEGYGKKTCIISGGLGTITVSHQGTTYYVCCTGCKSAFEDDPDKWIARAEKQKKK